jgi:D-tyrosyl-tRNA(Tyr) deacylase
MRAVVQRVASAAVTVDGERIAAIEHGLLVLLGVHADDDEAAADRIADKLLALRIFEDGDGRMNVNERVRERLDAQGGAFGAHMLVELVNDGPVTLVTEV